MKAGLKLQERPHIMLAIGTTFADFLIFTAKQSVDDVAASLADARLLGASECRYVMLMSRCDKCC